MIRDDIPLQVPRQESFKRPRTVPCTTTGLIMIRYGGESFTHISGI